MLDGSSLISFKKILQNEKKLCLTKKINKDDVLLYFFHVFKNYFSIYLIIFEENFYVYIYCMKLLTLYNIHNKPY